jgi:hypothetical protein
MLNLTLLLLFQTPSLDDAVAAFAKGDESVREEIVKLGVCSILPLRKVRDRAPERIDALLFDLKQRAESPSKAMLDKLQEVHTFQTASIGIDLALAELSDMFPMLFDPALFRSHWDRKVQLNQTGVLKRETLESFCRQLGLDYAFYCGVVLIAEPVRLWPATLPPRAVPLTVEESAQALKLIEKLASEQFRERETATAALMKLGKGAIPLLEKGAQGEDAERRARCQSLIRDLTGTMPEGTFHRPAAARQKLAGGDDDLRTALQLSQVSFKVHDIVLDGAMRLLLQPRQVAVQIAPAARDVRLTLDLQNQSSWAVIALATHCCGFDFMIQDGKVVIDTREEIQRRLAKGH